MIITQNILNSITNRIIQNDGNVFEEHIKHFLKKTFMFMTIIQNILNSIAQKGGVKFPGINCYKNDPGMYF